MIVYLSLLVAIVGLLIYVLATTSPKVTEIGRLMFFAGLLAFLLEAVPRLIGVVR